MLPPLLLLLRVHGPDDEPLLPEAVRNADWFCARCLPALRCEHRIWRSLLPGREAYHSWFSRFHAADVALSSYPRRVDFLIFMDPHTAIVAARPSQLAAWLQAALAYRPLLLAHPPHGSRAALQSSAAITPALYFVANVSGARAALGRLASLLPRLDSPSHPRAPPAANLPPPAAICRTLHPRTTRSAYPTPASPTLPPTAHQLRGLSSAAPRPLSSAEHVGVMQHGFAHRPRTGRPGMHDPSWAGSQAADQAADQAEGSQAGASEARASRLGSSGQLELLLGLGHAAAAASEEGGGWSGAAAAVGLLAARRHLVPLGGAWCSEGGEVAGGGADEEEAPRRRLEAIEGLARAAAAADAEAMEVAEAGAAEDRAGRPAAEAQAHRLVAAAAAAGEAAAALGAAAEAEEVVGGVPGDEGLWIDGTATTLARSGLLVARVDCATVWARKAAMRRLNQILRGAATSGAATEELGPRSSAPSSTCDAGGEGAGKGAGVGVGGAAEAVGAAEAAEAEAADAAVSGEAWTDAWPSLLIIVKGAAYATWRTPPFVRSLLASRSTPLRVYVMGDAAGLAAFRGVWRQHGTELGLGDPRDRISMLGIESSVVAQSYLASLHPQCDGHGYAYLFLKLLAPQLFPAAARLIALDSDVFVVADPLHLWREFDSFGPSHLVSMAPDQSDRYYYRLQDEHDEVFSAGWVGVPSRVGVNGGVALLHAERMRAADLATTLARLTHEGVARRDVDLRGFCELAEQDTLNFAFARQPSLWRPLDCGYNYMATQLGGHRLRAHPHAPLAWYDVCPEGVFGSGGRPGDLLHCRCGARVQLLHFAGGVRGRPLLGEINRSLMSLGGDELRSLGSMWRSLPLSWDGVGEKEGRGRDHLET